MNYSSRRNAVIDVLKSTKEHPSADIVFERCRKIVPSISLGTVYRNLQQLEKRGEIIRVASVNGKERYDADTSPHMHVICPSCGSVSDYMPSERLSQSVAAEMRGNRFQSYGLNFYSICNDCKDQN